MNSDQIGSMLEELRTKPHSDSDTTAACRLVAENSEFRTFIVVNLAKLLDYGGIVREKETYSWLRGKLADKKFEQYFLGPYLAAVAIGFKMGKEG